MGGPEKVARHHGQGKLTVRERVDGLLDPGTFHEIGSVTGVASYDEEGRLTALRPANFIYGRGDLDGRRVVVEGDDFTVRGGAADASIWDKMVAAEQMARELRLPLVRLVDGTGGGGLGQDHRDRGPHLREPGIAGSTPSRTSRPFPSSVSGSARSRGSGPPGS